MPRPRRAAASRAAEAIKGKQQPNVPKTPTKSKSMSQASKPTSSSPNEQPRRKSLRTRRQAPRSLSRRRADFDRLTARLVAEYRDRPDSAKSSSTVTDIRTRASDSLSEEVELTADYLQRIVDVLDDDHTSALMMKAVVQILRSVEQRNENDNDIEYSEQVCRQLAEMLATDAFITHQSAAFTLLTACALAELLRISAPDPLISKEKLYQVCSLFIRELNVLAVKVDDMDGYRFSLLEQLATVKTFVIFADDNQIICDLFACLYAAAASHQTSMVRGYFAQILSSMLDEAEELSPQILDAMIAPFVQSLNYSSSAVSLAEAVLQTSSPCIQMPLCNLMNASVRQLRKTMHHSGHETHRKKTIKKTLDAHDDIEINQEEILSEHHENMADIIIAINRVVPEILIYVVPSVEDHIRDPDEEIRFGNVNLLAQFFLSHEAVSNSYPSLFEEFLSRERDISPVIRSLVCKTVGKLMVMLSSHRTRLDSILSHRVMDKDEQVRIAAVRAVGEALSFASSDLLKVMSSRLRDRKSSVRAEALKQLNMIYRKRAIPEPGNSSPAPGSEDTGEISGQVDAGEVRNGSSIEGSAGADTGNDTTSHLGHRVLAFPWLPQTLLRAHVSLRNIGDIQMTNSIERVIFETVPCVSSDEPAEVIFGLRRLAVFLEGLDESTFTHFITLVEERKKCRDLLVSIAEYRQKTRKRPLSSEISSGEANRQTFASRPSPKKPEMPTDDNRVDRMELHRLSANLSRFFHRRSNGGTNAQLLCSSLANSVDLRVHEKILKALQPNNTYSEYNTACQDAIARVGSRQPAGIFLRDELFPKCIPGIFNNSYFVSACDIAIQGSSTLETGDIAQGDEGANSTAGNFPVALCGILRYLEVVAKLESRIIANSLSKIQALVNVPLKENDSSTRVISMGLKLISRLPAAVETGHVAQELNPFLRNRIMCPELFNVEQCVSLAKWSSRAAIRLNLYASGLSEFWNGLLSDMSAITEKFDGNLEAVLCPLASLSQLAKHNPRSFKRSSLEFFDFARLILCGTYNAKIGAYVSKNSRRERSRRGQALHRRSSIPSALGEDAYLVPDMITDFRGACLAEVVHRCVKLVVYSLISFDSRDDELDNAFNTLAQIISEKSGDVFGILKTMQNEDSGDEMDISGNQNVSDSVRGLFASSRLSAGRGVLYLSRQSRFLRRFTPDMFSMTMLLARDDDAAVRMTFARTVFHQMLQKKLPFRWISALALIATDPISQNVTEARAMLTTLIRNRRKVFEKAKRGRNPSFLQLIPEASLPELIWILAHTKDFDENKARSYQTSVKCLELLLDRLLESDNHASVLQEFIDGLSMTQSSSEREDEGPGVHSKRLYSLGGIAAKILKRKQAGKKWNLSQYPGRIALPKDMYRLINRKAETSGVEKPSLVALARRLDNVNRSESPKKDKPGLSVMEARTNTPVMPQAGPPSVPKGTLQTPSMEGTPDLSGLSAPSLHMHELRSPFKKPNDDDEPVQTHMELELSPPEFNAEDRAKSSSGKRGRKRRSMDSEKEPDRQEPRLKSRRTPESNSRGLEKNHVVLSSPMRVKTSANAKGPETPETESEIRKSGMQTRSAKKLKQKNSHDRVQKPESPGIRRSRRLESQNSSSYPDGEGNKESSPLSEGQTVGRSRRKTRSLKAPSEKKNMTSVDPAQNANQMEQKPKRSGKKVTPPKAKVLVRRSSRRRRM